MYYYYNQCTSSTWHWTKEHDNTIYIATYVKGVSTTYVYKHMEQQKETNAQG